MALDSLEPSLKAGQIMKSVAYRIATNMLRLALRRSRSDS